MLTRTMLAMPFAERATYAARMALIGILAVFGVLAVLWGTLALFRFLMERFTGKKAVTAPPAPTPAPVEAQPPKTDDTLVAVITAAVAATLAKEGESAPSFRVVSFKRAPSAVDRLSKNN